MEIYPKMNRFRIPDQTTIAPATYLIDGSNCCGFVLWIWLWLGPRSPDLPDLVTELTGSAGTILEYNWDFRGPTCRVGLAQWLKCGGDSPQFPTKDRNDYRYWIKSRRYPLTDFAFYLHPGHGKNCIGGILITNIRYLL